jgi:hypothetical protein
MPQIGQMVIFNPITGKVLNSFIGEIDTSEPIDNTEIRPDTIDYITLPYGDTTLIRAISYHVDTITREIVVDERLPEPEGEGVE